jgi:RHS repeat-associated protein
VNSCNIKENIIVKERADSYSYTFEIQLNNLEAVLCEDGSVAISDPDTDEIVYTIPKGYMFDADGAYSEAVGYTLANGGNGKYSLTVTADAEWINVEERVFPITIDPTIFNPTSSNAIDVEFSQYEKNNSRSTIPVGGGSYLYWHSSLPTLPTDAHIAVAYLSYRSSRNTEDCIGAYIASSSWIDKTKGTPELNATMRIDYQQYTFEEIATPILWYTWNITEAVNSWYHGSPNYGIWLKNEEGDPDVTSFYTYNCSDTSSRPQFVIRYSIMSGIESYWSYTTQNAGLAGAGAVNYATGELTFSVGTMTTGDALFGYTPSLIYSSNKANQYDIFEENEDRLFDIPSMAYGWHLSTDETISWNRDEAITENHYVLTDNDGTKHYFLPQSEKFYKDEDGLNLSLHIHSDGQQLYIVDANNNFRYYKKYSDTGLTAEGAILTSCKDAYGNELSFTRDAAYARLDQISVIPLGSETAIPYFTFVYNESDQLFYVENSTRGRSVTFVYSDNPAGNINEGTKYLREIIYSHKIGNTTIEDAKVSYTYSNLLGDTETGDGYRLASATDEKSGYRLEYYYDSVGRVCKITEFGLNNTTSVEGKTIVLNYENASTIVTALGADNLLGTDDDIYTYYVFDAYGRVVNSYSTDVSIDDGDPTIYGAVSGTFEDNDENPNRIKSSVVANNIATTLLLNGDFHVASSSASNVPYWTASSSDRIELTINNDSNKRGIVSFYPTQNELDILSQTVRLTEGEYTLSAYYSSSDSKNANAYLQVRYAETDALIFQKKLSVSDVLVEDNFDLLSFTIDPPGDATSANYKICFSVVGNTNVDDNACVSVDKIMLERGTGAGYFDLISAGNFDSNVVNDSCYPLSDFWTLSSAYDAAFGTDGTLELECSDIQHGSTKATQTIYTCTTSDWDSYRIGGDINGPTGYYVISGFGKNENAFPNPTDAFSIGVEIDYYDRTSDETETVRHMFPFYYGYDNWQYVQGSIEIESNRFVKEIRAVCENSYNFGVAYFDNISMYKVTDGSIVENEYYTSEDATTAGLDWGCTIGQLKLKKTPLKAEAYMYHSGSTKMWYSMDTEGNYYTYEYNTAGSPTTILYKKYDTDLNMSRTFLALRYRTGYNDLLESTLTTYEYDAYGLETSVSVQGVRYDANDDPIYSLPLKHSTTYNYQTGSQYFGSISSETDSSGNQTQYSYDTYGRLIYARTGISDGLYYFYNDLDQITSIYPLAYDPNLNCYYASPYGEMAAYEYHTDGSLSTINTRTTEYSFTYDAFGNKTSISIEGIPIATYEYYPNNGLLKKMTYATGIKVENFYDKLDRLVEVCYTDTNKGNVIIKHYRYHYTKDGSIARVDDVLTGAYTVYQYSTAGALMEVIQVDATNHVDSFFTYTYNDQNAISTAEFNYEYAVGDETALGCILYSYGYDDSDKLARYNINAQGSAADGYISFVYDDLGRTTQKNTQLTGFTNGARFTFIDKGSQHTTALISTYTSIINNTTTTGYTYTYDNRGNITRITDSAGNITTYVYDDQNQLTRENFSNAADSTKSYTYVYEYDNAGNRTSRKKYAYTTGSLTSLSYTEVKYEYNNAWGDQLTKVGSTSIAYDALGNPTTYNGYDLTWEGRQLMEMSTAGGQFKYTFEYNDEGLRTSKTSSGLTHKYVWEGSTIVSEAWGNHFIIYLYDESGSPIGMQYRAKTYDEGVFDTYYFEKNLQGDIIAVYNAAGNKLGSYTYDAWGNFTTSLENTASSAERRIVNTLNPFRYRGYYYDTETGLYYLQSRYYNPQWGRFLNADGYVNANGDLVGFNMYTYCSNNPVMYIDPSGEFALTTTAICIIIGAVIGFAGTAYADYSDDGEIFNGSVTAFGYIANTAVCALAGGMFSHLLPALSTFMSSSIPIGFIPMGNQLIGVTVSGAQLVVGGVVIAGVGVIGANIAYSKHKNGPMRFNDGTGIDPDTGKYFTDRNKATEYYKKITDSKAKANFKKWLKSKGWRRSHLD